MRLAFILSIAILLVTGAAPRLPGGATVGGVSAAEMTTDLAVDLGLDVEEEKAAGGETDLAFTGRSGGHDQPFVSMIGRAESAVPAAAVSTLVCRGPPVSRCWRCAGVVCELTWRISRSCASARSATFRDSAIRT